jgi:hypothetical protein
MQLLTVATAAERDAVSAEANVVKSSIWIGLESVNMAATTITTNYRWLSTGRTPTTPYWNTGEPNNAGSVEGICVTQLANAVAPRNWAGG